MENYSILMTVYKNDNPQYVKLSIDSMLNQTIKSNDFVIVCDGPLTTDLNSLLNNYTESYRNLFNIINLKNNVGLGEALGIGITKCKNELIARMDSDDIADVKRCELEIECILKNENLSIVGSNVAEFDSDPNNPIRIKTMPTKHKDIIRFSKRRNPFNHPTVMLRKSKVLSVGNYSKMRTNQDVELWMRMLNNGCIAENIDLPLLYFRFDNNTYSRRKNWENVKLLLNVWNDFQRKGFCTKLDYYNVVFVQTIIFLMPKSVVKWCYDNFR